MEEEGEEVLKDNIMHDIKEGFIQRRLPDGGFKVMLTCHLLHVMHVTCNSRDMYITWYILEMYITWFICDVS